VRTLVEGPLGVTSVTVVVVGGSSALSVAVGSGTPAGGATAVGCARTVCAVGAEVAVALSFEVCADELPKSAPAPRPATAIATAHMARRGRADMIEPYHFAMLTGRRARQACRLAG
jgi:hypothetical protein